MGTQTFVGKLMEMTPPPRPGLPPPTREIAIISFHYAADGTAEASCNGLKAVGRTDGEALRELNRKLNEQRKAAKRAG
jgi:hypothetical protein